MTENKPKIVITNWIHDDILAEIEEFAVCIANRDRTTPWSREDILERGADADGLLAFMTDMVDEALLREMPNLKTVSCAVRGYDNFDIDACVRRDVTVAHVPDLLQGPTADLTLGAIIALTRHMLPADRYVRSGNFEGWRPHFYGLGLAGTPVGIVGMGGLGRAIAKRLFACEANVIFHDRQVDRVRIDPWGTFEGISLDELLSESRIVILALPLVQETHHLIDRDAIAKMQPGTYLINPARGSVADELAIGEALKSGRLAGYAADVFAMEDWRLPNRPRSIPRDLLDATDRTVFTPHLGSAVDEVRRDITKAAAYHLAQFFRGETPDGAIGQAATSAEAV
ncbi:NAD(P)-dependent oxidoreductase [Parvibaculum sp.]|uniref:NAD(P)-dependent oxidoreductase n=1 Tax=Parvibaculum sp. TaxID=2024848 RepID=UPI000C8D7041|nr:NAD(P)-dependent oxidoreductase [Parvibaculum sp.]MAB15114.1 hydroxyacid dehydrogenase [Parvibaculum sp.]